MSDYLLGDVVRNYRQENHLSLRAFGEMCGISHTTIDCIEKGYDPRTGKRVNITNMTFSKLSDVLKIPVSVLVDLSVGIDDLHRVVGGWMTTSAMTSVLAKDSKNDIPQSNEQQKKPIPEDGDGLDPEQAEIVRLYEAAPPALRAAALAVLRSAEGQDKVPGGASEDE